MSQSPLLSKVGAPYARALFDYLQTQDKTGAVTEDFSILEATFQKTKKLMFFLKNPLVLHDDKKEVLGKLLTRKGQKITLRFFDLLAKQNRVHVFENIASQYLQLAYTEGTVRRVEIATPLLFTKRQQRELTKKLQNMLNVKKVKLVFVVDSTLIGGIILKTYTKRVDFTIKNKLEKLSKLLETDLDI